MTKAHLTIDFDNITDADFFLLLIELLAEGNDYFYAEVFWRLIEMIALDDAAYGYARELNEHGRKCLRLRVEEILAGIDRASAR